MSRKSCNVKVRQIMREENWSRDRAEKYFYGGLRHKAKWEPNK